MDYEHFCSALIKTHNRFVKIENYIRKYKKTTIGTRDKKKRKNIQLNLNFFFDVFNTILP